MSHDVIADALNQIMNAKKVEHKEVQIKMFSKPLIELLTIMKKRGHIDFTKEDDKITIKILNVNECKAIKPRYFVRVVDIDKYLKRFLPSRNFGTMIISTNKGLMDQFQAEENKLGGSLIAYFY
ncbi:MAG: 30S ribosomal protein S8 [Nanoarchaeota archaeon]|nr:30S ribosomal protein S8 [Nanoarchaeota archaeon]